jgi:hypothetical protein
VCVTSLCLPPSVFAWRGVPFLLPQAPEAATEISVFAPITTSTTGTATVITIGGGRMAA